MQGLEPPVQEASSDKEAGRKNNRDMVIMFSKVMVGMVSKVMVSVCHCYVMLVRCLIISTSIICTNMWNDLLTVVITLLLY